MNALTIVALLAALAAPVAGFGTMPKADPCACSGNQGKSDGSYYPLDMGNGCMAWDETMDYCMAGGSSEGADWCDDPWCYVPEGCPGAAPGSYFPGEPALFYSYDVC